MVTARVRATLENNDKNVRFQPAELQTIQMTCTLLTYNITSVNKEETVSLTGLDLFDFGLGYNNKYSHTIFKSDVLKQYPDKLGLLFTPFKITRHLKSCPFPFNQNITAYFCSCPPSLSSYYGLSCDTTEYKIIRSDQQWIGVTSEHSKNGGHGPSILAHKHCPFDYCRTDIKSLSIDLEHVVSPSLS